MFKNIIKNNISPQLYDSILSFRYSFKRPAGSKQMLKEFRNKKAVEIGGPTFIFKTIFPVYQTLYKLDGINYSRNTVWTNNLPDDDYEYLHSKKGKLFIAEGTDLKIIESGSYEAFLSSNCLEHIANPLKALFEWKRVLMHGGILLLVLPKRESNHDHKRPITSFQHIVDDYKNDTQEDDLTALEEILELHDLTRDEAAGSFEEFKERSLQNHKFRCLHHHVYDMELINNMLEYIGLDIVFNFETNTDYFAIAKKK